MRIIRSYFRLTLFAIALLFGVQIPGFIHQYSVISQARLAEAEQNLAGFQQTADEYFGGSLEKLIVYYQQKDDRVMNADGRNINGIYQRVLLLKQEQVMLQKNQLEVAWYLSFNANQDILAQAKTHYSYVVPLNVNAIAWGVCAGILFAALFDLISLLIIYSFIHTKRSVYRKRLKT